MVHLHDGYPSGGGCPGSGGSRGLAGVSASRGRRQGDQPSISPTTTAGAIQVAKPISTHDHGLIPDPKRHFPDTGGAFYPSPDWACRSVTAERRYAAVPSG